MCLRAFEFLIYTPKNKGRTTILFLFIMPLKLIKIAFPPWELGDIGKLRGVVFDLFISLTLIQLCVCVCLCFV